MTVLYLQQAKPVFLLNLHHPEINIIKEFKYQQLKEQHLVWRRDRQL